MGPGPPPPRTDGDTHDHRDGRDRMGIRTSTGRTRAAEIRTWPLAIATTPRGRSPSASAGRSGSGKTALLLALVPAASASRLRLGVVTNDIFTREDAEFLHATQAAPRAAEIRAVERAGARTAAIREDANHNLIALEELMRDVSRPLFVEAAATTSRRQYGGAGRFTIYVIDVAGGTRCRAGGAGDPRRATSLLIGETDRAPHGGGGPRRRHGARRGAHAWRRATVFAQVTKGVGVEEIEREILAARARTLGADARADRGGLAFSASAPPDPSFRFRGKGENTRTHLLPFPRNRRGRVGAGVRKFPPGCNSPSLRAITSV